MFDCSAAAIAATPRWRRLAPLVPLALALALVWAPSSRAQVPPPTPGLSFEGAQALALERAPLLAARRAALDAARSQRISATELPDPQLSVALENLPISGPMRWSTTAEPMTQRSIGWMQEVPNAAKRAARGVGADARIEREDAMLRVDRLMVQREVARAWLTRWYAEQKLTLLATLDAENRLLIDTVAGRVAAGTAMPAEATMAQQDALMLADRRDGLRREVAQARAMLARWLDADAASPLLGPAPALALEPGAVRAGIEQHADLRAYEPMLSMSRAETAEAESMRRGDWSWQVMYSRRAPVWGDMVTLQLNFELPLWGDRRQEPQIEASRRQAERIAAEREDLRQRRREEIDLQLAELDELQRMADRLRSAGVPLAEQRVALAMAAYESARGSLAEVLSARRERAEVDLRALDLEASQQRLRANLNWLIEERH